MVSQKALAVYVALKSRAGVNGRAWPSHQGLAKDTKLSVSAVKGALNELRESGLVSWKGRIRNSDGRQTSNDYKIHDDDASLARLFPPGS